MVVDSSAVVAILLDEEDATELSATLTDVDDPLLSAASLLECSIVMHKNSGVVGLRDLDDLLQETRIRCVPVDLTQALAARRAWVRFGKGNSPAGLNFGDCFSYALARTMDRPLLFKGGDFTRTDVRVAR
ncbi:type II toxin-antitoxin system VapC family toxin [Conexibacter woesei]|uniref:Ribonuclease VapC n=1 Tax=Conexibacter woesei (strain DSM 14684 / CCUG 47730 / CIP 108061 / JCM 11494 / NBRC 100937 / ID131577) TaxID=469383 RepID=D3F676_CONWI|nr:PilT protein domain protein [Conexibacter woesei DSM 14684]